MSINACTDLAAKLDSAKGVADIIALCKRSAREKRFEFALDLVSAAIHNSDNDTEECRVKLLDTRIWLHIRLKDWDAALNDANSMLHAHRTHAGGYLRSAEVERRRKNLDAAIEYLRRGLMLPCVCGSQRDHLTKEMSKLKNEIEAQVLFSKPKDPLTTLPLELVELIFQHLRYRQLIQMLRVSKSYYMVLCTIRPIVDTLKFPRAQKVSPRMLQAALGRWKVPKVIRTARLTDASLALLNSTIASWQILQTLEDFDVQGGLSLD